MRVLTVKGWGVLAAVAVLMAAVVASAFAADRHPMAPTAIAAGASTASQLGRCRALGPDAEEGAACRVASRRMRDHFFELDGRGARP